MKTQLILPVLLACFLPVTWALYLGSNRDPFILGACLLVTLSMGPISALVLGIALKKVGSKQVVPWILVGVNFMVTVAVVALLVYGWLRSQGTFGLH